jgi:hypothetical protein
VAESAAVSSLEGSDWLAKLTVTCPPSLMVVKSASNVALGATFTMSVNIVVIPAAPIPLSAVIVTV